MTPADRALAYIQIFIGAERAGQDWRGFVPVDGELVGDRVHLDGIEVGPGENGTWFVKDGDKVTWWRPAVIS